MLTLLVILTSLSLFANLFFVFVGLYIIGKINTIHINFAVFVKALPEIMKNINTILDKHKAFTREIVSSS
jgi:hypothetical protein